MRAFELTNDFVDEAQERELLAAVQQQPELYRELEGLVTAETFAVYSVVWQQFGSKLAQGSALEIRDFGTASSNPAQTARQLVELEQKRLVAETQQRIAGWLYGEEDSQDTGEWIDRLALEVNNLKTRVRKNSKTQREQGGELLEAVLAMAIDRQRQRVATGREYLGVATGMQGLDQMLNGLCPGLHLLAAGPGVGKTTLALQWAVESARLGTGVVYVSYENSAANLMLKLLAAAAGTPATEIERGYGDGVKLTEAAGKLKPALERLVIVEGVASLTMWQVESRLEQARRASTNGQTLLVMDYLQRAAHQKGYDQLRHSVSALGGELREMANRTGAAVVAISSQNRSGGEYGKGAGSAQLDSLKESGDLEYAADTAMFLMPDPEAKATLPARAMRLVVVKNRFGATGGVKLVFRPDVGLYREAGK